MTQRERPLSPHLDVYRWQISNTLSIVHRATGFALSLGALALVGWLVSIASGADTYETVHAVHSSFLGRLALFGWTFCFFYHCCNGIRHLCWDAGKGFDKRTAQRSGMAVVTAALFLTAGLWVAAWIG